MQTRKTEGEAAASKAIGRPQTSETTAALAGDTSEEHATPSVVTTGIDPAPDSFGAAIATPDGVKPASFTVKASYKGEMQAGKPNGCGTISCSLGIYEGEVSVRCHGQCSPRALVHFISCSVMALCRSRTVFLMGLVCSQPQQGSLKWCCSIAVCVCTCARVCVCV
jgi:hypothetical protein